MVIGANRRGRWWAAALAAWMLCAPTAWAACKLSKLEIPVRIVNHRPVGTLTLNGTEVPVLIDSGAFFSMLPRSTATQLGLSLRRLPDGMTVEGYTGPVDASVATVERVGLRGNELRNVDFIVGGNELGSGIQGILGRNFLSMADTEYDLAHGELRLMFPKGECDKTDFAYWAGEAPVILTELENNFRDGNDDIRVSVRVNGVRMRAIMDTGAPVTTLRLRSARRAGVKESELQDEAHTGGVGDGRVRTWKAQLASFELGGEKVLNNFLRVDDTDHLNADMLIGLDYFLSHRIYVSRLQRKVYATWNGGPVFARGGPDGHYDARYAAKPADVSAEDAEALARRGEAAAARGEYARALADLNRACELAPTAEANFLARARVHLAMDDDAKAQQDLDRALGLRPGLQEALAIRASLRAHTRDRAGALADLVALDATLPPSSHLRDTMARTYLHLDLAPEALRQWDLWVPTHREDSRLAEVLNNRCWLRARLNIELKLALDDCRTAVSRERDVAAYRDSLGWTYLRLNDLSAAVDAFDAALKIKPGAFSHYGRALVLQRLGRVEAAGRDLAAARKLDADIDERVRQEGFPVAADAPAPAVKPS